MSLGLWRRIICCTTKCNIREVTDWGNTLDFVTAWKAISILLTGAFGVMGLLKEFKDKTTGKITKWGAVSLAGILMFSTFGFIAQLKESSSQQKSRDAAAQQTLSLAQKTDRTVRDIQRILSPFDSPLFLFKFTIPCTNIRYKAFCSGLSSDRTPINLLSAPVPSYWDESPFGAGLPLEIHFFQNSEAAREFIEGRSLSHADFMVYIQADFKRRSLLPIPPEPITAPPWTGGDLTAWISVMYMPTPLEVKTNGKIKSVLDLPSAIMLIALTPRGRIQRLKQSDATFDELALREFRIKLKNGQEIHTDPQRFEKIRVADEPAYRYVFLDSDVH
jgi:hypothetical protein